ncbi:MAG: biotin--[acetyl-CoA-carboxylase] ligase [Treponema sp.]|nr:biotin--[acetyl-CoA-carboxylase] ligase [Treponema sp.]
MSTKDKVLSLLIEARSLGEKSAVLGVPSSVSGEKNVNSGAGASVSGEKLAAECGVSRAAIWKAVNALRSEGIAIEGTTNGGYILCDDDIFTTESFTQILQKYFPDFANSNIEVFKEIDSTNTYAKRVLTECGNLRNVDGTLTSAGKKYHQSIIAAESQTAGRGRLGRTFVSPAKTGIYLSVIYAPVGGITNPAKITAFSAVAVCRAIKELYGIECQIKWINDIYAGGKKICGILTEGFTNFETGTIESAIIGIGINMRDNPALFPTEVAKVAGSIEGAEKAELIQMPAASSSDAEVHSSTQATVNSTTPAVISVPDAEISPKTAIHSSVSRAQLAAHVAANLLQILEETVNTENSLSAIMQEYKSASFLIGKTLTVHPIIGNAKTDYTAKAVDIDDNAALVVELSDGTRKALSSGEVSIGSGEFVR